MSDFSGLVFAPRFSNRLGTRVADELGVTLAPHEEREFEGGEHKSRALTNVRGRDAYVIASLDGDDEWSANDKLCRLLFLVGALREASVGTVTAVVPYLCYARKDRQTKARDPVTTRYVATLFEAMGTDRVVTLDVHNLAAFQNAFRIATDHLEAAGPLLDHLCRAVGDDEVVVVSPDIGGLKSAERFRQLLSSRRGGPVELGFARKHRSGGVLSGPDEVVGADVDGRAAVVLDDMIATGGTMRRVAESLVEQGAAEVRLVATHGVFVDGAETLFTSPAVRSITVTDSVDPVRLPPGVVEGRLEVVSIAPLLADAIARLDAGGSLAELLRLDR